MDKLEAVARGIYRKILVMRYRTADPEEID
jgi:hypothetical protein